MAAGRRCLQKFGPLIGRLSAQCSPAITSYWQLGWKWHSTRGDLRDLVDEYSHFWTLRVLAELSSTSRLGPKRQAFPADLGRQMPDIAPFGSCPIQFLLRVSSER